ncbi:MAG: SAM-dependent methyltransferase [Bdellovibrionota bacterium]
MSTTAYTPSSPTAPKRPREEPRFFEPSKVPVPPDFFRLPLDPSRPVDVEIGCGVGFHPLRYARENPERQLVAFEKTSDKFAKFLGRLKNHDALPNLIPVHGDAVAWISHAFAPESVDRYFLLYPNPYPKESQRNLRFHAMPFFSYLRATLKKGGTITMATNEDFLVREACTVMRESWGLKLVECRELARNATPRTHFEKKYLERGERCWNLVWIRS